MVNQSYEKSKTPLIFSKKQIERAGRCIRKQEGDLDQAVKVIQNFRSAHSYPLTIIKNLVWKHVRTLELLETATVARRLKRLPTILDKLQRSSLDGGDSSNAMDLRRMQDIGGCRVIVQTKSELEKLNASLDTSRTVHESRIYSHLAVAKDSGYRGIHRCYKTYSKKSEHAWKGFNIELQLRTKLQHVWATGVEIIDVVENESLKTNPTQASYKWKRLLVIFSAFLAQKDGFIEMDIGIVETLRLELFLLTQELHAIEKLNSFNRALVVKEISTRAKEEGFTLLKYDLKTGAGSARFFPKNRELDAMEKYAELEAIPNQDVILIAGRDIKKIEKAYPNYLGDSSTFVSLLAEAITNWS
jgi:ppGpp synthetase/RelA/SpoT-type nucleotidyltranferase